MTDRYMGELTFSQILRVIKTCWVKSLVAVAATFLIVFTATLIVYQTGSKTYYTASFTYGEKVEDYAAEVENVRNPDLVGEVLLSLGYDSSDIEEESLVDTIVQNISISAVVSSSVSDTDSYTPTQFTVQLNKTNDLDLSDNEYKDLLNSLVNGYVNSYRSSNVVGVYAEIADFDYSSYDYLYASELIEKRYESALSAVNATISSSTSAKAYRCEANGKTFSDVSNRLDEISLLIEEYRVYVIANALSKSGADVSVIDYLKSKLAAAEADYSSVYAGYAALVDSFNKVAETGGFGSVSIDLSGNVISSTVSEDFYALIEDIREAAVDCAVAESELLSWREIWLQYGGTITEEDGKTVYTAPASFPAVSAEKAARADELFATVQSELQQEIAYYNEIAEEYNETKLGSTVAYVSVPARKTTERNIETDTVVLLNVACVALAFLVVNVVTYFKMKRKGCFIVAETPEEQTEKEEEKS